VSANKIGTWPAAEGRLGSLIGGPARAPPALVRLL